MKWGNILIPVVAVSLFSACPAELPSFQRIEGDTVGPLDVAEEAPDLIGSSEVNSLDLHTDVRPDETSEVEQPDLESECKPACDGKECGKDGCGGTCGDCPGGAQCDDTSGLCLSGCGDLTCDPEFENECNCPKDCGPCATCCSASKCVPESDDEHCGTDGQECVTCQETYQACDSGKCIPAAGTFDEPLPLECGMTLDGGTTLGVPMGEGEGPATVYELVCDENLTVRIRGLSQDDEASSLAISYRGTHPVWQTCDGGFEPEVGVCRFSCGPEEPAWVRVVENPSAGPEEPGTNSGAEFTLVAECCKGSDWYIAGESGESAACVKLFSGSVGEQPAESTTGRNWDEVVQMCHSMGAVLYSPNGTLDYEQILNHYRDSNAITTQDHIWLGLQRQQDHSEVWLEDALNDETDTVYQGQTYWDDPDPDNPEDGEPNDYNHCGTQENPPDDSGWSTCFENCVESIWVCQGEGDNQVCQPRWNDNHCQKQSYEKCFCERPLIEFPPSDQSL